MLLEQSAGRLVNFLANAFFMFQGVGNEEEREARIKGIMRAIACELPTVSDGLFYEFGYEINEKEHYFKLEGYFFMKFRA